MEKSNKLNIFTILLDIMKRKQPKFTLTRSEDYREYFATGVVGGMNPNKCSIGFFEDKPVFTQVDGTQRIQVNEVQREMPTTVKLTPVQLKQIAYWMTTHVNMYEEQFGKIELKKEDTPQPQGFIS